MASRNSPIAQLASELGSQGAPKITLEVAIQGKILTPDAQIMLLLPCSALSCCGANLFPWAGCNSAVPQQSLPMPPCFGACSGRGEAFPAQNPPSERYHSLMPLLVAASGSAGPGRQARGGEDGRQREMEALRDIHSKFIGAKLQSAWICFLWKITGSYRHQQLLFK